MTHQRLNGKNPYKPRGKKWGMMLIYTSQKF